MIYFRPRGGLCNRIRAIDSMICLSEMYHKKLIILWVNNASLNCSFYKLFQNSSFNNINVIEFNEKDEIELLKKIEYKFEKENIHKNFNSIFPSIEIDTWIFNSELSKIYNSKVFRNIKSLRQIDVLFFKKINKRINKLLRFNKVVYISSCYRLSPIKSNYNNFIPSENILNKVKPIVDRFNNTIGLHIRRGDHIIAQKYSRTQLFDNVISKELMNDSTVTFFLATDCAETKKQIILKYGEKIICNNINSYDRNDENAIFEAMIDLQCLSKTKKVYGSHHSSFSQMAADMGNIKEINVRIKISYKDYLKENLLYLISLLKLN
jgi:hypothetical protein